MNFLLLVIFFTALTPHLESTRTIECYHCNIGYHSNTPCTIVRPGSKSKPCTGQNPTCVQSIEWFQNGSLQLLKRACSDGDYCKNFSNKVGVLKQCKTCQTDLCNGDPVYEPYPTKCQ
ncbi:uncharacterized protein LOC135140248 [Zophobas morio]|uniref:uncharacterized protein LOC135140248 n=1 Tax=Zophobas morio TaxID=2755281 RepID=UPI003082F131